MGGCYRGDVSPCTTFVILRFNYFETITFRFAGHPERPAANLAPGGRFQSFGRRSVAVAGRAGPLARRQLDIAQALAYEAE